MIKKIIKRWKEIKALINSDEYFLAVANSDSNFEPWRCAIKYNYMTNTNRQMFYTFVHDSIENEYRTITGTFVCIRDYNIDNFTIVKNTLVVLKDGCICNILSVDNLITIGENVFKYRIPTSEIFSHFKLIK